MEPIRSVKCYIQEIDYFSIGGGSNALIVVFEELN